MTRLILSALGGAGVSLLILDRRGPSAPAPRPQRHRRSRVPAASSAAVGAGSITWLLFGSLLVATITTAVVGLGAPALAAQDRKRQENQLHDAWPRLLDEARVLCGAGGLSLPQALFQAGRSAPGDLGRAWSRAERAWGLSADLPRSLRIVAIELGDPTSVLVCSTLEVLHRAGAGVQHDLLARLAADRRRDANARRSAESELAGARFARRFVVIVPVGMALAGQAVGTGRAAFATPSGQVAALLALAVTAACWLWSGRLLNVPISSGVRP